VHKAYQAALLVAKVKEVDPKTLELGFSLCWEMFAKPALRAIASDPYEEIYFDNHSLLRSAGMLQPFRGELWDGNETGTDEFEYPPCEPERSNALRVLLGEWSVSTGDAPYVFYSTNGLDDQKPYNKSASLEVGLDVYGTALVSYSWDGVSD